MPLFEGGGGQNSLKGGDGGKGVEGFKKDRVIMYKGIISKHIQPSDKDII